MSEFNFNAMSSSGNALIAIDNSQPVFSPAPKPLSTSVNPSVFRGSPISPQTFSSQSEVEGGTFVQQIFGSKSDGTILDKIEGSSLWEKANKLLHPSASVDTEVNLSQTTIILLVGIVISVLYVFGFKKKK